MSLLVALPPVLLLVYQAKGWTDFVMILMYMGQVQVCCSQLPLLAQFVSC